MSAPRVLIVEGDLVEAQHLEEAIFEIPERESSSSECGISRRYWWNARIVHASSVSAALSALADRQADLVLLNPTLSDAQGIDAFRLLRVQAPELPIILILENAEDELTGKVALREGAQDYLLRSFCDWESLSHAMENALERSRQMASFWRSFLADSTTGLPNRAGFVYLAGLLQTVHTRLQKSLRMILVSTADPVPDCASRVGDQLRECVEPGDLVGRVSATEFAIFSAELDLEQLVARLDSRDPGLRHLLQWSQWQSPMGATGGFESIDKLIANAQMLLPARRAATASAGASNLH